MAVLLSRKRQQENLTAIELGKRLGLQYPQLINLVECGACTLPLRHFKKAADILRLPVQTLVNAYIRDEQQQIEKLLDLI